MKLSSVRFSAHTLKWIALCTMTLDHIGVVFFSSESAVYSILRAIGRMAFPLYAFLLAEGARRTHHPLRYALRLGVFALLADPGYSFVLHGSYAFGCNVLWTLLLALLGLLLYQRLPRMRLIGCLAAAVSAELLGCDYGGVGVLAVFLFYFSAEFQDARGKWGQASALVLLCCKDFFSVWAFPALFFTLNYDGTRGPNGTWRKYFFYAYYPAHLAVLFFLRRWLIG